MKLAEALLKKTKIRVLLCLLILSKSALCTAEAPATDFSIYPEDIETTGATTIFKDIDFSTEKILGAYYFGTGASKLKDARSGLVFLPKNNVIKFFFN